MFRFRFYADLGVGWAGDRVMATENNRSAERKRVLKGARILFNGHNSTIDVAISDLSQSGCRLKLESMVAVPEHFDLHVRMDDQIYPARVVWRKVNELGVEFTGAAHSARRT